MKKVRKAIAAIIFREKNPNKILLVNKVKNEDIKKEIKPEWDIPKGGIKEKETEKDALIREIKEETGLKRIKVIKKLKTKIVFKFPKKYCQEYKKQETTVFVINQTSKKEKPTPKTNEIKKAKYFNLEKALTLIKYKETKKAISEFKKNKDHFS